MTQQRLNSLFMLYVHTAYTDSLELRLVAEDFVSVNTRRLNYFGKFEHFHVLKLQQNLKNFCFSK